MNTEVIRDAGRLAELAPEWWTLWRQIPNSTIFQTPAWNLPWWDVFRPGELRAIALWQDERLLALAPLYLESGQFGERLLPIGIGLSDFCDVLIAPECAEAAAAGLTAALKEIPEWENCEFAELSRSACAFVLPPEDGWRDELRPASVAPVLRFLEGANSLADVIPRMQWRNVRRARAAAQRLNAEISQSNPHHAAYDLVHLVRLHTKSWSRKGEGGVFADDRVEQFHRRALPHLMHQNLARMYSVHVGGEVIAVCYGFIRGDWACAYLQGFDPDFAKHSPGLLLMAHAIEQAMNAGAREFHFLRGDEAYKFSWGALAEQNQTRLFFRPPK